MALPAIAPYPMPGSTDLPQNKVSWTPEPRRAVLLIHDMQRYFVEAFTAGQSPITELVANIRLLRQHCAELGIPVVYSAQPGGQTPEQRGLLLDFWGAGINGGAEQKQIIDALTPAADDILLTKWRYSAFRKTQLANFLSEQGRNQLIISGIYAHIGCLQTASDGFMSEVQPFFVADAVADFSLDHHHLALRYAAQLCAVTITTQRLIDELRARASQRLTRQQVRADVAELLLQPASAIGEEENLLDRGLDSLRIMSLVERWRRTDAEISFVQLAERPTLSAWYALLCSSAQPPAIVAPSPQSLAQRSS
jgi:bifunctional isochorismate lyase/aryl carrier protein